MAVDLDSSSLARLLGLSARLEQAGDVEPDVEADRPLIAHGYEFRPRGTFGQGTDVGDRRLFTRVPRWTSGENGGSALRQIQGGAAHCVVDEPLFAHPHRIVHVAEVHHDRPP